MRETPCTSIVRTPLQGRPSTPKRASYPCLGSSSSWCPIMPFVRAAAYLYEPSSRRAKVEWAISSPSSFSSSNRRWRFHCLYPGPPISTTTYTFDELSRALLLSSHNDSVSLDNERSIDRPVILGVKSMSYFDGRWKSGRWVSDYWWFGITTVFSYSMDRFFFSFFVIFATLHAVSHLKFFE